MVWRRWPRPLVLVLAIGAGMWGGAIAVEAWENPTITPRSTRVRAVHINELRTRINAVRARWAECGQTLPQKTWTLPDPMTAGSPILAVHIQELRNAIREVYAAAGKSLPFGEFANEPLQAGSTPIRAIHITQLREAVDDPQLACCCTAWDSQGCAAGGCVVGYRLQTRDCTSGATCPAEQQCTADCSCGSTCGGWTNGTCGGMCPGEAPCAASAMQQTRTCTPSGCGDTCQCVAGVPSCCDSACSSWANQACGGGSCTPNQRQQTRTCPVGSGCVTSQCLADASCPDAQACTNACSGWTDGACGVGSCPPNQRQQTRTCLLGVNCPTTQCKTAAESSCVTCQLTWDAPTSGGRGQRRTGETSRVTKDITGLAPGTTYSMVNTNLGDATTHVVTFTTDSNGSFMLYDTTVIPDSYTLGAYTTEVVASDETAYPCTPSFDILPWHWCTDAENCTSGDACPSGKTCYTELWHCLAADDCAVACAMDVFTCPDESTVSRQPPDCNFPPCPLPTCPSVCTGLGYDNWQCLSSGSCPAGSTQAAGSSCAVCCCSFTGCSAPTPCGTPPNCTAPACSSGAACNDGNACTTDVCNNAGTCSASCSNTNNPVNCVGSWGSCSVSCGGGTQTYTVTTSASCGGTACPSADGATQSCNTQSCQSCTPNSTQSCTENGCTGTQTCNAGGTGYGSCSVTPVNGGWSGWSGWGSCSATCGGGTQSRTRTCTSPSPSCGGAGCSGSDTETQSCNTQSCEVSCAMDIYTCPDSTQLSRQPPDCNFPPCPPYCGDDACNGGETCSSCPGDCGACPCGGATPCGTPPNCTAPACSSGAACNDGNACTTDVCNNAGTCSASCSNTNNPVNCVGSWGSCSVSCGGGTQTYTVTTSASCGGTACPSANGATQSCNTQACDSGTCSCEPCEGSGESCSDAGVDDTCNAGFHANYDCECQPNEDLTECEPDEGRYWCTCAAN